MSRWWTSLNVLGGRDSVRGRGCGLCACSEGIYHCRNQRVARSHLLHGAAGKNRAFFRVATASRCHLQIAPGP